MEIRRATIDDIDSILHLKRKLKETETKYNTSLEPFDKVKEHYRKYTRNDLISKHRRIYLAIVDDKIVGMILGKLYRSLMIAGYKRRAYVSNLFVMKDYRKKGIGKALYNDLCNWFRENKVQEITLEIYSQNKIAQKLYKSIGFKEYSVKMKVNFK